MTAYDPPLDPECPYCGAPGPADNQETRNPISERLWQRCLMCGCTWEPPADDLTDDLAVDPKEWLHGEDAMVLTFGDECDELARELSHEWLATHRPQLYDQDAG